MKTIGISDAESFGSVPEQKLWVWEWSVLHRGFDSRKRSYL